MPRQFPPPTGTPAADAAPAAPRPAEEGARLVEHLLGAPGNPAAPGSLEDFKVAAWAEDRGMLEGGRAARAGASCLLRPAPGDRVLAWCGGEEFWVLAVLERADQASPAVLAASAPGGMVLKAPRVALTGEAVHIVAEDFLSSTKHRHAVESTRTETCKVRVSQVGTDIRRVGTADEEVSGTLLQRAGTWLSHTARDARLRARTFLFD